MPTPGHETLGGSSVVEKRAWHTTLFFHNFASFLAFVFSVRGNIRCMQMNNPCQQRQYVCEHVFVDNFTRPRTRNANHAVLAGAGEQEVAKVEQTCNRDIR